MRTFSEMDKHYDRHNEGICAVCGCTTARWKSVCDACRQQPNPEPTFKVGDWVEWCGDQYMVESAPPQSGGRYDIRSPYDGWGCSVFPENITRKLSPSEIIVKIGCLNGTIAKSCDPNYFLMMHSRPIADRNYSMIKWTAIDKETRELVESLLKAQEEENAH